MTKATFRQRRRIEKIIVEEFLRVLGRTDLSRDEARTLLWRRGELASLIYDKLTEILEQTSCSSEVASSRHYPREHRLQPIADQIASLRSFFPSLRTVDESLAQGAVPNGAEGWFAFPRWECIASTYEEALLKVLELLCSTREDLFVNHQEGMLSSDCLRQSAENKAALRSLRSSQPGQDILVVAAQFGLRHRGRSVDRAREVASATRRRDGMKEFCLGTFEIAIMLLTHPHRLVCHEDLMIYCGGDEAQVSFLTEFGDVTAFDFHGGKLRLVTRDAHHADHEYGSPSGFCPKPTRCGLKSG